MVKVADYPSQRYFNVSKNVFIKWPPQDGVLRMSLVQYGIFEQPSVSTDDYAPRPDEERDENLWVDDIEEEDEDEFSEIEHPFVKLQHPSKMSSVAGNNRSLDLLLSYGRPWCSMSTCTINQTSPSANALHLSKFTGVSDVWWMLAHSDCFPWARIVKGLRMTHLRGASSPRIACQFNFIVS
ncbi:hypothetical protein BX666DRAFT_2027853 [Dichotomocladium elegans]|nr:hypothetical protein BX666DRAFT_2027853 [Dichotomocladium elegans]